MAFQAEPLLAATAQRCLGPEASSSFVLLRRAAVPVRPVTWCHPAPGTCAQRADARARVKGASLTARQVRRPRRPADHGQARDGGPGRHAAVQHRPGHLLARGRPGGGDRRGQHQARARRRRSRPPPAPVARACRARARPARASRTRARSAPLLLPSRPLAGAAPAAAGARVRAAARQRAQPLPPLRLAQSCLPARRARSLPPGRLIALQARQPCTTCKRRQHELRGAAAGWSPWPPATCSWCTARRARSGPRRAPARTRGTAPTRSARCTSWTSGRSWAPTGGRAAPAPAPAALAGCCCACPHAWHGADLAGQMCTVGCWPLAGADGRVRCLSYGSTVEFLGYDQLQRCS